MEAPGFWDDPDISNQKMKELKNLKDIVDTINGLESQYEDIETLIEMGNEEEDAQLAADIRQELDDFISKYEDIRISTLLSEEYDSDNAILKLNAGAGGTESCDWCSMLYRMYSRWGEAHGYTVKLIDWLDGEEAGLKSATLMIEGPWAYGYLKSENGVHRLVRISPFDASGRRQTSFASIEVMPEFEDVDKVVIRDEDIERTRKSLDLIFGNAAMDLGETIWQNNIRNTIISMLDQKDNNFVSALTAIKDTVEEKCINETLRQITELKKAVGE